MAFQLGVAAAHIALQLGELIHHAAGQIRIGVSGGVGDAVFNVLRAQAVAQPHGQLPRAVGLIQHGAQPFYKGAFGQFIFEMVQAFFFVIFVKEHRVGQTRGHDFFEAFTHFGLVGRYAVAHRNKIGLNVIAAVHHGEHLQLRFKHGGDEFFGQGQKLQIKISAHGHGVFGEIDGFFHKVLVQVRVVTARFGFGHYAADQRFAPFLRQRQNGLRLGFEQLYIIVFVGFFHANGLAAERRNRIGVAAGFDARHFKGDDFFAPQADQAAYRAAPLQAAFFPDHIFGKFHTRNDFDKNLRQEFKGLFAFDVQIGEDKRAFICFFDGQLFGLNAVFLRKARALGGKVSLRVFKQFGRRAFDLFLHVGGFFGRAFYNQAQAAVCAEGLRLFIRNTVFFQELFGQRFHLGQGGFDKARRQMFAADFQKRVHWAASSFFSSLGSTLSTYTLAQALARLRILVMMLVRSDTEMAPRASSMLK